MPTVLFNSFRLCPLFEFVFRRCPYSLFFFCCVFFFRPCKPVAQMRLVVRGPLPSSSANNFPACNGCVKKNKKNNIHRRFAYTRGLADPLSVRKTPEYIPAAVTEGTWHGRGRLGVVVLVVLLVRSVGRGCVGGKGGEGVVGGRAPEPSRAPPRRPGRPKPTWLPPLRDTSWWKPARGVGGAGVWTITRHELVEGR